MIKPMIDWNFRNNVLNAVYNLRRGVISPDTIHSHFGDQSPGLQEVDKAMNWLADRNLIKAESSWGGGIFHAEITPLGSDYIETGTSVEDLAKAAVQGSIINAQTNHNHGPSINNIGDHNTSTQNINDTSAVEKVIAALRDANEVDKADELQQEANQNGVQAALKKAAGWIGTNAIAAPIIGQIAPTVFTALGM